MTAFRLQRATDLAEAFWKLDSTYDCGLVPVRSPQIINTAGDGAGWITAPETRAENHTRLVRVSQPSFGHSAAALQHALRLTPDHNDQPLNVKPEETQGKESELTLADSGRVDAVV